MLGTIEHRWGHPEYLALDVRLDDGQLECSGPTAWRVLRRRRRLSGPERWFAHVEDTKQDPHSYHLVPASQANSLLPTGAASYPKFVHKESRRGYRYLRPWCVLLRCSSYVVRGGGFVQYRPPIYGRGMGAHLQPRPAFLYL